MREGEESRVLMDKVEANAKEVFAHFSERLTEGLGKVHFCAEKVGQADRAWNGARIQRYTDGNLVDEGVDLSFTYQVDKETLTVCAYVIPSLEKSRRFQPITIEMFPERTGYLLLNAKLQGVKGEGVAQGVSDAVVVMAEEYKRALWEDLALYDKKGKDTRKYESMIEVLGDLPHHFLKNTFGGKTAFGKGLAELIMKEAENRELII